MEIKNKLVSLALLGALTFGGGCATKLMLDPDCSTKAVNRALIFEEQDYETRMAIGSTSRVYNSDPETFLGKDILLLRQPIEKHKQK